MNSVFGFGHLVGRGKQQEETRSLTSGEQQGDFQTSSPRLNIPVHTTRALLRLERTMNLLYH